MKARVQRLSQTERAALLQPIYGRGDRILGIVVAFHTVLAALFAAFHDTWFLSLCVAPLAALLFFVPRYLAPRTLPTRIAAGVALQVFCALHIYQLHGQAEQHFWFFTSTTVLVLYQDPRAIYPGVGLIIAQHILFALLHNSGVPLYFFEESYVGVFQLTFHFGIALVQAILAATIAKYLRERTLEDTMLRQEIEKSRRTAEKALHSRSRFLANMGHEVRTPMNGVEGMADLLLTTRLDAEQQEFAETIRSSSQALLHVLNDVLDFSKLESGAVELEEREFAPAAQVQEVLRLYGPRAADRDVRLDLHVEPGLPTYWRGDPARLRQMLLNLIGNGIKFAPGGEVRVALHTGSGADHGRLVIEVLDTGIGIAQDKLEAIFRPFEQADPSITRRFGGTGLGLAITQALTQRMGGRLEVESTVGKGSLFRLVLPLAISDGAGEPPAALPAAGSACALVRTLRVLLVDDQPVNRRVGERMLARLGHLPIVASDGESAIERLRQGGVDLVLLDCQMPGMDGYQTARRWREVEMERGLARLPILALTADVVSGQFERCLEAGMDACHSKPITLERLVEALAPWSARPADQRHDAEPAQTRP
ncbi:MAG: response regulator [Planctomycetaceae bacterium]|nr:response regulator [Planctomycetaceae bacterium]